VVTAKRLVVGHVAIDLLPGPSEVLVLADETADPKLAAADLLAQAEHGSGHERVWLITTANKLLTAVKKEIQRQLPKLARKDRIRKVLDDNTWLVGVETMDDAVDIVNALAPEHCEVMAKGAEKISNRILTAGAIFLGSWSPTVLCDYVAGPSHTLPTGGAGASFPGLTVDQFQRRTSVVEYSRPALKRALGTVRQFAALEGLDAHGRSAEARF
jgi:histidinol dehydrogenase